MGAGRAPEGAARPWAVSAKLGGVWGHRTQAAAASASPRLPTKEIRLRSEIKLAPAKGQGKERGASPRPHPTMDIGTLQSIFPGVPEASLQHVVRRAVA